jgi:orotidine-5'-phosphate decarboxylase
MAEPNRLSTKRIPANERLILALDVPSAGEAMALAEKLGDAVAFYKLGLQLFMAEGYFPLVRWLRDRGKKVFVDLKFFDVPETVGNAVSQLREHGADFVTVHGNDDILRAAVRNKGGLKVLAVTVLTSLDENDLADLGFACDVASLVLSRARRALGIGCDGVISSGLEAEGLREALGGNFLVVAPGIRGFSNAAVRSKDDQKRTVDLEEAFLKGADYIVVGRPIRNAADPVKEASEYQRRIRRLFEPDGS